jgi:hypothetical protein
MKIIIEKKKKGLWANIHAKRERGESPSKPGEEDYPDKKQWNKLTKEELEQLVTEELKSILETEQLELPLDSADKKKEQADQIKNAEAARKSAEGNLRAASAEKSSPAAKDNPAANKIAKKQKEFRQAEFDFAKSNEQETKKMVQQEPVTEEKSNFQKEMQRKGKGWKVRLLTKGKQPTGSAYPNKAPMERAKSAPPGAGGV